MGPVAAQLRYHLKGCDVYSWLSKFVVAKTIDKITANVIRTKVIGLAMSYGND